MNIINRYIIKNLLIAVIFVSVSLTGVVFLAQSLRFLELVMDSGASGYVFWILTALALPRFMEIILPLAITISVVFVYNRMFVDNELVSLKALGMSPIQIAKPALLSSFVLAAIMFMLTIWVAPTSLSKMQEIRQVIKAKYSLLLFKESNFNTLGDDITIYVSSKSHDNTLHGIMIHDRGKDQDQENPFTIIAEKGVLTEDENGTQKMIVYGGSRQEFDPKSGNISRLNFERYTVDLPESAPIRSRWQPPDERSFRDLLFPDTSIERNRESIRQFFVEANKRIITPLLAPAFVVMSLSIMLVGYTGRKGLGFRIAIVCAVVFIIQGGFIALYNVSRQELWAIPLMYMIVIVPLIIGFVLLSSSYNLQRIGRKILLQKTESKAVI